MYALLFFFLTYVYSIILPSYDLFSDTHKYVNQYAMDGIKDVDGSR